MEASREGGSLLTSDSALTIQRFNILTIHAAKAHRRGGSAILLLEKIRIGGCMQHELPNANRLPPVQ